MNEDKKGIVYALSAYLIWGLAPLYFKQLQQIAPLDLVSHRVIWSSVFLFLIIILKGRLKSSINKLKDVKLIAILGLCSLLITTNWLIYIWAISNNQMLDASLGYFINPLINVVLGYIFLKESFSKLKWFAVLLALIGVMIQIITVGRISWVSMILPISFGLYGLIRKKIAINALLGLLIETSFVTPVAIFYLNYFSRSQYTNIMNNSISLNLWLMAAGIVTSVPLLLFGAAASRVKLSLLGFFQYISPSLMFLIAIFLYKEELNIVSLITFIFIWSALFIFILEKKIIKLVNKLKKTK